MLTLSKDYAKQSTDLSHLTWSKTKWMNHPNPRYCIDVLNLLIILNSILKGARWNECTELLRVNLSAVLPETVKTLHFDTASTANSEQFCDLC